MSTPTLPIVTGSPGWDGWDPRDLAVLGGTGRPAAGTAAPGVPNAATAIANGSAARAAGAAGAATRRARARQALPAARVFGDALGALVAAVAVAWAAPLDAAFGRTSMGRASFAALCWGVMVAALATSGAYSRARRHIAPRVADDLAPLAVGLALAGLCLLAVDTLLPDGAQAPAGGVGLVLLAALVAVPACRSLAVLAASARRSNVSRVVVVGSDEVARGLVRRLSRSRLVEVVGVVDDQPAPGLALLGTVDELPRICEARQVDRVVMAFSAHHPSRSAQVLLDLPPGVDIDVVARYYELTGWESRISDVTGLSVVSVGRHHGRGRTAAKRALDLAVAGAGLVLLSPLLLVIAVAVRLDLGGPVLFRQVRVGRGRQRFHIVKFRTMRPAPPSGGPRSPLDPAPDPARITRLGRLLRRSGLDELPQLLNVLRGEMSVVGPRPFVPEECAGLQGWTQRRFDVRPGMTGMWQVCGQHELTFEELCRLDVQYATSWTIRSDLRILARTPGRLFQGSAPGR